MAFVWKLLVCLLLATVVYGQTGTISVETPSSSSSLPQGTTSDYYFVEFSEDVEEGNSVTITLSDPDNNLNFIPGNSFTLGPHQRSFSFRVASSNSINDSFAIHFEKTETATDNQYVAAPADVSVSFVKRKITFETFPSNTFIGQPSQPIKISIEEPSDADLVFDPTTPLTDLGWIGNNTVTFSSPIIIPAGSLSTSFTYTVASSVVLDFSIYVEWEVTGGQDFYVDTIKTNANFHTELRPITIPTFGVSSASKEVIIGAHGNNFLLVYTRQQPNGTFNLYPQAADTTFTPDHLEFNVNTQIGNFSYVTTSPETSKTIYWFLDQDPEHAYYAQPEPTTIKVPQRKVFITMPDSDNLVLTNRSQMTVALVYPTPKSVTVNFYAAHLTFSVPYVTFTGSKTSFSVAIDPKNIGSDVITFKISGDDAEYYADIADQSVTVNNAQFTSPTNWYVPNLYIGVTSPKVWVRAAVSPITKVTLTPTAPNLRFDPPALNFRNGSEMQSFTITPLYTNDNDNSQSQIPISFLVTGADHAYFTQPDDVTVTVGRRFIQNDWSAHLDNTNTDRNPTSNTLHLGKTYKIWSSVNYIGDKETVTMTPVSPYFSFNPKVVTFGGNSKTTRVMLEATCTGVVGSTRIDYIIGGNEGGWYTPVEPKSVTTAVRPLAIEAAVLATDNRIPTKKAALVDWPDFSTSMLTSQWTVYSFKLRSFVLADKGLKITPKCPHADFSPSSISIDGHKAATIYEDSVNHIQVLHNKPHGNFTWYFNNTDLYLEANFTVHPKASGYHQVTFELSGDDADFYERPADQFMRFRLVNRDSDEPKQAASAGVTLPSLALFVVALICATFM